MKELIEVIGQLKEYEDYSWEPYATKMTWITVYHKAFDRNFDADYTQEEDESWLFTDGITTALARYFGMRKNDPKITLNSSSYNSHQWIVPNDLEIDRNEIVEDIREELAKRGIDGFVERIEVKEYPIKKHSGEDFTEF